MLSRDLTLASRKQPTKTHTASLVPMTGLPVLFNAFVHVADVMFLGVFVSIPSCHHLFSVIAGIHVMAIVSSGLSGSTVLKVPVACYQLVLSGSSAEQCRVFSCFLCFLQ